MDETEHIAAALEEAGRKRAALVSELDQVTEMELKPWVIRALDAGITFRDAAKLGRLGVDTVARWRKQSKAEGSPSD